MSDEAFLFSEGIASGEPVGCIVNDELLGLDQVERAQQAAGELIEKGEWTGTQLDFLERIRGGQWLFEDDIVVLIEMREQREREEALRR